MKAFLIKKLIRRIKLPTYIGLLFKDMKRIWKRAIESLSEIKRNA